MSRIFDQSPLYYVTFNTWKRQLLLDNHGVHEAFRSYAIKNSDRGFSVGRYVIMPDHIHFFVRVGVESRLDQYIRLMKQRLTKCIRELSVPDRIWQPGFFDHVMRSSESYSEKWRYVRMNPVKAGLVEDLEDWPYRGEIEVIHFP